MKHAYKTITTTTITKHTNQSSTRPNQRSQWKAEERISPPLAMVVLVSKCHSIIRGIQRRTTRNYPSGSLTGYLLNMVFLLVAIVIWSLRGSLQWGPFFGHHNNRLRITMISLQHNATAIMERFAPLHQLFGPFCARRKFS